MTTIFASGSRNISLLDDNVIIRLNNIINNKFCIIIGDAKGADRLIQGYLRDLKYENVVVFCSGSICRNNIGNWKTEYVKVNPSLRGRAFYTAKDKKMAEKANYGFVLWDGESAGSFNNIIELTTRQKNILVYFLPEESFYTISNINKAISLLRKCNKYTLLSISKTMELSPKIKELFLN